ncbi:MAG TPA: type II toxin-antitoxin system RelE/ParE family toxin [Terracidiphilus sp.]|nr:type II toxin-antitoxin system RelE/ParE family toxin [Terracidiphilus sp.]
MTLEVEVSDEFIGWYNSLNEQEGVSVDTSVDMLAEYGPALGRPHVDTPRGSRYTNLKELRVQHLGRPLRILFAFDPRRNAYLILGGDKTGDARWYVDAIRRAEAIYAQHLKEPVQKPCVEGFELLRLRKNRSQRRFARVL